MPTSSPAISYVLPAALLDEVLSREEGEVWVVDRAAGALVYANPRARSRLGLSGGEAFPLPLARIPGGVERVGMGASVPMPTWPSSGCRREGVNDSGGPDSPESPRWEVFRSSGGSREVASMLPAVVSLTDDPFHAIRHLAGEVAKGLGGPLTAMEVALARLRRLGESASLAEGAREIHVLERQTSGLSGMARDLVAVARPLEPLLRPVEVNDLVRRLEALPWSEWGIQFTMELDSNLPLAQADPRQLRQVLLALVANALKAMDGWEGPREVRLETRQEAGGGEIRISDSGPGVEPGKEAWIFQPFTSGWEGAGLGLYTAAQLVRQQGGVLGLGDPDGPGITFVIRLPAASEPPAGGSLP